MVEPIPTLPLERIVNAVVVPESDGSAKIDTSERLESEEVAETVKSALWVVSVVVPILRNDAMEEKAVVEVAEKLVKVKDPPFVRL